MQTQDVLKLCQSASRGRALHANTSLAKGAEILVEEPLCSMQLPDNSDAVLGCHTCLQPIGTLKAQLEHLTRDSPPPPGWCLPLEDDDDGMIAPIFRECACSVRFCSQACADHAKRIGHSFLCAAANKKSRHCSAIDSFRRHAVEEYDGFFLFCGQIVCHVQARLKAQGSCSTCKDGRSPCKGCVERAQEPYQSFCRGEWWEITEVEDGTTTETAQARRELKATASSSLQAKSHTAVKCPTACASIPFHSIPPHSTISKRIR